MTTSANSPVRAPVSGGSRAPLLTRALLLRFVSMVGSSVSFFLLLSTVPAYAEAAGGGGGAGLATGALMLSTVLGELVSPRLVARWGNRLPLTAGLLLLGVPALVLTVSDGMVWIVAVCLVRGLGFALTLVAGGALTASLIPAERRGEGLALVGLVGGASSLVALPLGLWLARHVGYGPVAVAAGVAALAAIASVPGLPDGRPTAGASPTSDRPLGMTAALRGSALRRPALVFATTALAAGILVTFLPLAVPSGSGWVVSVALVVQPGASTAARWVTGRYGDRHGSARFVVPGLLLSAAGMLLIVPTAHPVAVVAGAAVFGVGFGVTQNATLTLMYARTSRPSYGTVTALWNLAYDGGMGVGAAGFGLLAAHTGYAWAFALTATTMLLATAPAVRDARTRT
ncbi:MFS transporter [Streptomyces sp. NPDC046915]|uniref:MFS transporter n=1 Tax=Streptomyces sp. NPDC046915 TaxID=3155257 RepID=UPI0033F2405B